VTAWWILAGRPPAGPRLRRATGVAGCLAAGGRCQALPAWLRGGLGGRRRPWRLAQGGGVLATWLAGFLRLPPLQAPAGGRTPPCWRRLLPIAGDHRSSTSGAGLQFPGRAFARTNPRLDAQFTVAKTPAPPWVRFRAKSFHGMGVCANRRAAGCFRADPILEKTLRENAPH